MGWEYIAGFIDGEGSFTIASQKYYFHPRLSITQNKRFVLERIQDFWTQYGIVSYINKDTHKTRGNIWYSLRINDRKSLLIACQNLIGKLHVKEKQLFVILNILEIPSGSKTRHIPALKKERYEKSIQCRKDILQLNQERMV